MNKTPIKMSWPKAFDYDSVVGQPVDGPCHGVHSRVNGQIDCPFKAQFEMEQKKHALLRKTFNTLLREFSRRGDQLVYMQEHVNGATLGERLIYLVTGRFPWKKP